VTKTRLEAFSDGVLAIIITIMVLEMHAPHGTSWAVIEPLIPVFISYIISFCIVGIYWGNHHHLLHAVKHVNSKLIWANLHLLFWLSLIPFATAWMGENNFSSVTIAVYAAHQTITGIAYYILLSTIMKMVPENSPLRDTLHKQSKKGLISFGLFAAAIPSAFYNSYISLGIFGLIAISWWLPDRNIEKTANEND
jgi:uncharacterized membrane protein